MDPAPASSIIDAAHHSPGIRFFQRRSLCLLLCTVWDTYQEVRKSGGWQDRMISKQKQLENDNEFVQQLLQHLSTEHTEAGSYPGTAADFASQISAGRRPDNIVQKLSRKFTYSKVQYDDYNMYST